ncbi:AAA family ATPase [Microbispora sp. CA-135349]|uniref:AAA family ATPase n=1 Tax=Microbispora sp. CA-135349 TaxID=3239953 RepID=UPI003D8D0933
MITRIEIDGFKSFADFKLDLPPFLAVIGSNASGKSNLFDALRFISAQARGDLYDGIDAVRGDAVGLFRQRGDGSRAKEIKFGVELIVDPDRGWGRSVPEEWRRSLGSRWRYELWVTLKKRGPESTQFFIPLVEEDDSWPDEVNADPEWRAKYVTYLDEDDDAACALLGEDGFLHLFTLPDGHPMADMGDGDVDTSVEGQMYDAVVNAILKTLAQISAFQLEDAALRKPSALPARPMLRPNGEGLPGYLSHLRQMSADQGDEAGVLAEIRADLARIVREVTSFDVVEDHERRDVRVVFDGRYVPRFGADVASDGTLRILALLAMLNDSDRGGLVAVEEPENGVFPERLRDLLATMRRLVSDPSADDPIWPLKQVLVTSHSPVVLDAVPRRDIVFLENLTRIQEGVPSRVTVARRLVEPGQPNRLPGEDIPRVTESEIERFRAGREPAIS